MPKATRAAAAPGVPDVRRSNPELSSTRALGMTRALLMARRVGGRVVVTVQPIGWCNRPYKKHDSMPKRLDSARARAAVAAGDPPLSVDYPDDDDWHAAQDEWLAKWSVRRGGAHLQLCCDACIAVWPLTILYDIHVTAPSDAAHYSGLCCRRRKRSHPSCSEHLEVSAKSRRRALLSSASCSALPPQAHTITVFWPRCSRPPTGPGRVVPGSPPA